MLVLARGAITDSAETEARKNTSPGLPWGNQSASENRKA